MAAAYAAAGQVAGAQDLPGLSNIVEHSNNGIT
jgi:hypothetical protein